METEVHLLGFECELSLESLELFAHLYSVFLVQLLELLILELEEHDLEHLLLSLIALALAVVEATQGRNHYLLAHRLQDRLALQLVSVFDKV